MNGLEKILKLAREENGKFFVLDESGEPSLVVMSMDEYDNLKSGSLYSALSDRISSLTEQTELLNRQITAAQRDSVDDDLEIDAETSENELSSESVYIEPIEEE